MLEIAGNSFTFIIIFFYFYVAKIRSGKRLAEHNKSENHSKRLAKQYNSLHIQEI